MAPVTLPAQSNKTLQALLTKSEPYLRAEILDASPWLPADLLSPQADFHFTISKKHTGALAQYNAETGQTFFFRQPLLDWLRQTRTSVPQDALPPLFARCAAPLYLHEAVHARHARYGKTHQFFWPLTLEDEYVASFWQLDFIRRKLLAQPDYYLLCTPFMPPAPWLTASAERLQTLIYKRYTAHPGNRLPPPLRKPYLQQAQESPKGEIIFLGKTFRPRSRRLTLNRLFTSNSDWTHLRPAQLFLLPQDARYCAYRRAMNAYLKQTVPADN